MPVLHDYHLFISHAWNYGGDYDRVVDLLNKAPNFSWSNYSRPRENPIIDPKVSCTNAELYEKLKNQIRPTGCVLVLSGMYTAYSKWIQKELDYAVLLGKPIVGIKPWGNERVPTAVSDVADTIVGWNTSSIVDAIRKYSI